ncbi:MAG: cytidylate kinase family protein, partial [bacterium]
RQYLILVKAALLNQAVKKNIVYHGHTIQALLKDHYWTLKVKLIAGMEYRIEQAMIKQNLTRDEAIQYIFEIDKTRKKWIKFLHGTDWDDPTLFDLVLNIQVMDPDAASEAVIALARRDPFCQNEISDKIIRQMHLVSKAEVALLEHDETKTLNVDMDCREQGIIELKGTLEEQKLGNIIKEIVRTVEGIKEIKDNFTYTGPVDKN